MKAFADGMPLYYAAGWPGILPVPIVEKWPPPKGCTGDDGVDTCPETLARWAAGEFAGHSVALRIPLGVLALDVDHYVKGDKDKRGGDTLAARITAWGPLPATWASTARGTDLGAGPSRTLFYRVPVGRYGGNAGADIDVLQHHHRYCVVWPSRNPQAPGNPQYRWYGPDGQPVEPGRVPKVDEFPALPARWVAGLAGLASAPTPGMAAYGAGDALLRELRADLRDNCALAYSASVNALERLAAADAGSRHDTATGLVYQLIQLGAVGHPGCGRALEHLGGVWHDVIGGEHRDDEWHRMLLTAARKAVTEVGLARVPMDPCAMTPGMKINTTAGSAGAAASSNGSAPGTIRNIAGGDPGEPRNGPEHEAPVDPVAAFAAMLGTRHGPINVRSYIGTGPFDPVGGADQTLAEAALHRMDPALRYAWDAGAWVLRGPWAWTERGELAEWAATELTGLMPQGDPTAGKGTDAGERAARRAKFANGAGGIPKKMRALVAAGTHPSSLALAGLDSEPEILWAGGLPWRLRDSTTRPVMASDIDPATPHMMTADVFPMVMPTPRWDDFLAALWPDPAVRAWAVRVLSIAVTGYADAALPILLGLTGRGKTTLIRLIMDVLGTYAGSVNPKLLIPGDNSHDSIVMALKGLRLAYIDEGPRRGEMAAERVKQLTGGAPLTGNRMRCNPLTFRPTHTLILSCDNDPPLTDPALRRRVRLIPCEGDASAVYAAWHALSPRDNPGAWEAEQPGVLAMLMSEAARWLADPSSALTASAPDSIRCNADTIAGSQNLVASWIEAEMVADEIGTKTTELWVAHCEWRRRMGGGAITRTKFGRELTDLGHSALKRMDANYRALRPKHEPPRGSGPQYVPTTGGVMPTAPTGFPGAPTVIIPTVQPDAGSTSADAGTSAQVEPQMSDHSQATNSANAEAPTNTEVDLRDLGKRPMDTLPGPFTLSNPTVTYSGQRPGETTESCLEFDLDATRLPNCPNNTYRPRVAGKTPVLAGKMDGSLDSSGGSDPKLSSRSDQPKLPLMDGMDGLRRPTTKISNNTESNRDSKIISPTTSSSYSSNHPSIHGRSTSPASPAAPTLGTPPKRSRKITKTPADIEAAKASATARRQAASAASRVAKVAAAAGEFVGFPATVVRGHGPVGVSLSVAIERVRLSMARNAGHLDVDIESTGYPLGHQCHAVRMIQLGDDLEAIVLDPGVAAQRIAAALLMTEASTLGAFSATADLCPLAHCWPDLFDHEALWVKMHDVALPSQLALPSGSGRESGLKARAPGVLGAEAVTTLANAARQALFKAGAWARIIETDTELTRSGWAQVPTEHATMLTYGASDVLDTARLAKCLPVVADALYGRERTAQRAVARVSLRGVRIDERKVRELHDHHGAGMARGLDLVRAHGIENPGSSSQVGARLIELGARLPLTAGDKPSVAKGALMPYVNTPGELGDCVRALREWSGHAKAMSTYVKPYLDMCTMGDGRARPTIYSLECDTGRMSSARPNVQNIPREGGFRSMLRADDGYLFISADFSGVELRVACGLSQDKHMLKIILADDEAKALDPKAKSDIHWLIAQAVYGMDAAKPQRYRVKNGVVFPRIYGSAPKGIAASLGIPLSEVEKIVAVMDGFTPGLTAWSRTLRNLVDRGNTRFHTYSGRVIHLNPNLVHAAGNYAIQGTARELLVDALCKWSLTKWGTCTLFPVHDEVVIMVPAHEAEEALATLVSCMECELFGVPIKAEAGVPSEFWRDSY